MPKDCNSNAEIDEELDRAIESDVKIHDVRTRAVESESEGILGGVGVGKKCTDSDLSLKS
jgi:hypothetical protein